MLAATPAIEVRRGTAVAGLLVGDPVADGVPHVVGVRTEAGEEIRADLVVDATGRRSPLPRWLDAIGVSPPEEEIEDVGYVYYGRHFRSADGSIPPAFGGLLMHHGSFSVLTLPADHGTWGVGIIASADDAALRRCKDSAAWEGVVRSLPLVAHWLDGEPMEDDVVVMAKLEDRHRRFVVDGRPVATGVVAVADSWSCTNPSVGRGATIGAMHAVALRDAIRTAGLDEPLGFVQAFDAATTETVEPWFLATQHYDRHRLATMRAAARGEAYEPGDPVWDITCALEAAAGATPQLLRGMLRIVGLLATADEVVAEGGLLEAAIEHGTGEAAAATAPPGPTREQLLEIVGA